MPSGTETEFKLRAVGPIEVAAIDAAVREEGFACKSMESSRHVDLYLDDALGSLASAGIGIRVREDRLGRRIQCKRRGHRTAALFVREEIDAAWPAAELPRDASELPQPLRDEVEPFVLARPLGAVLRLVTERDLRVLQREDHDVCELAIDRVHTEAGGREAAFVEVELEVLDALPSCECLAKALVQRLPLGAAGDDKPSHAAALLGLPRPAPGLAALNGGAPAGAALAMIAARHLDAMRHAEVGVRSDQDATYLHTMRVAVRRLRGLVRAFRASWPAEAATWILAHLGETGHQLGALRDLDVMLDALPDALDRLPHGLQKAGGQAMAWVQSQRDTAHDHLHAWLRSPTRLADADRLQRSLADVARSGPGEATLGEVVPARLAKAVETVRKLIAAIEPDLPIEPLHELRIASKRLRYLAEEFAALPPHDYEKSLAAVTRVQQVLGIVCDHEVAAARLLAWIPAAAAPSEEPMLMAATLGGLAAAHAASARRARKAASRCLSRLDRKKVWRRFPAPAPADATLAP